MSMATVEYWDENEFNFFETLEDEDKLLYLYDLMIGEFFLSTYSRRNGTFR